MSTNYIAPNVETHVAETKELPPEPTDLAGDRPDEPTPSLWQKSVTAKHKKTREPVVVARVDWGTMLFRPYWPERKNPITGEKGIWSPRTEWQSCSDFEVDVTFSPTELAKQEAHEAFMVECAKLDADALMFVESFCDDPDPKKNLSKLAMLRRLPEMMGKLGGLAAAPETVVQAAVEDTKKAKGTK